MPDFYNFPECFRFYRHWKQLVGIIALKFFPIFFVWDFLDMTSLNSIPRCIL